MVDLTKEIDASGQRLVGALDEIGVSLKNSNESVKRSIELLKKFNEIMERIIKLKEKSQKT